MTKILRAKDIMKRDVVTVPPDMDVWSLAALFAGRGITGAPVVDAQGELKGVVSQTDIVAHLEEVAGAFRHGGGFYSQMEPDGGIPARQNLTAGDLMSPSVVSVGEETPVHEISQLMLSRGIHRIIITRDGRVGGIVTTMDLLKVL